MYSMTLTYFLKVQSDCGHSIPDINDSYDPFDRANRENAMKSHLITIGFLKVFKMTVGFDAHL